MKILIAGCGYVGSELGLELAGAGHEVWGLRRSPDRIPTPIHAIGADLTDRASLDGIPDDVDALVYAASADESDAEAYRAAYVVGPRNLARVVPAAARVVFVSSTAVYGERRGAEVDDDTEPSPGEFRGEILLEAEEQIRVLYEDAVVVRASGIYGPDRTRLVRMAASGRQVDDRWTNRIHRDDLAAILGHALARPAPAPTYLASDRRPARLREVLAWIAARLADEPDPADEPEEPRPSDARLPGKRCIPRRLLGEGFRFVFPTWREGYAEMLADEG